MKLIISSLILLTTTAVQAWYPKTILDDYDTSSVNGECEVTYSEIDDGFQFNINGNERRQSLGLSFTYVNVEKLGNVTYVSSSDYPGSANLYFIPSEHDIKVIMIWEDNELGPDDSTFCRLPRKALVSPANWTF